VRLAPVLQRAIAFALVAGKGHVDLVEPPLCQLDRHADDLVVEKTLNDSFAGTSLRATLQQLAADRVVVAGWATDFCVDTTVRSAVSNGFHVVVAADAHTVADRPHLAAAEVIRHHNWVWKGLITDQSIRVVPTDQLIDES